MAFTLPNLSYAFDAIEPNIDAMTMEIHHDKHHATYVTNLNAALEKFPEFQTKSLDELVKNINALPEEIRSAVRNSGGGHWNHSLFWELLSPQRVDGSQLPKLAESINKNFGDYIKFQEEFKKAALGRFGSGWVWLIKLEDGKLKIVSTPNQDNPLMDGIVPAEALGKPVLGLDVWEHAYYLKYQNKRADYVDAFWNNVNWNKVEDLLG